MRCPPARVEENQRKDAAALCNMSRHFVAKQVPSELQGVR